MEQTAAPATSALSMAAVVSFVAGLLGLSSPWLFPVETIWLDKTDLPGHQYLGSATAFLLPVLAIAAGHIAISRTRPGRLRGRTIGFAGLTFGYVGLITTA